MPEFVKRQPQQIPTQEFRESQQFYQTIGYPEYGGKYAPFKTPRGYKISRIQETPEGLSLQFEPVELDYLREGNIQFETVKRVRRPEPDFLREGNIQLRFTPIRQPRRQEPDYLREGNIALILQRSGQEPSYYERDLPPSVTARKLLTVKQPPVTLTHSPMYVPTPQPVELVTLESMQFYKSIGFAQFGGKYEPFIVPEGYKVKGIKEAETGLEVEFESLPKQESKGIAETLASYATKPLINLRMPTVPSELVLGVSKPVHPFAGIAGVIAPTESLVYSVGRLAGVETPKLPPTMLGGVIGKILGATEYERVMGYGSEYAAGTVMGDILLNIGIGKAISVVTPPIKAGVEKIMGYAEKTFASESYYYYKYILEKPMLTTMTKEYARGTVEALIGEEAYLYTSKIGLPTLTQKTLPRIVAATRTTIMETPIGEVYLYGKAVAYPTFKYVTLPQFMAATSKVGTYAKSVFMESPLGETYLYGKGIAHPTFKYAITTKTAELTSIMRSIGIKSPLGEAYLYAKGVAIPQYVTTIKGIPKMLPSLPFDISELKLYAKSYISDIKLYGKSYFGKQYVLPMPTQPSYPMKPLWQLPKTVEFAEKPISINKTFATTLLKESPATSTKPLTETLLPMTAFTTGTFATSLHGWKGMAYPFRPTRVSRITEDVEETILHYPKEPLTIREPKMLTQVTLRVETHFNLLATQKASSLLRTMSRFEIRQTGEVTQKQRLGLTNMMRSLQLPKIEQVQTPMLKQLQIQQTTQIQKLTQMFPTQQRSQFREPNFKRMTKGLFGGWGKRTHALPTEKQIMRQLGFTAKRRRTHKRKR